MKLICGVSLAEELVELGITEGVTGESSICIESVIYWSTMKDLIKENGHF